MNQKSSLKSIIFLKKFNLISCRNSIIQYSIINQDPFFTILFWLNNFNESVKMLTEAQSFKSHAIKFLESLVKFTKIIKII